MVSGEIEVNNRSVAITLGIIGTRIDAVYANSDRITVSTVTLLSALCSIIMTGFDFGPAIF